MLFYTLVLQCYKRNRKKRKKNDTFLKKITGEKQNSVTIMISVNRKGTFLLVKLKLEGQSFE